MNRKLHWGDRWTAKHPIKSYAFTAFAIAAAITVEQGLIVHVWGWPDWTITLPFALITPLGGLLGSRYRWRRYGQT